MSNTKTPIPIPNSTWASMQWYTPRGSIPRDTNYQYQTLRFDTNKPPKGYNTVHHSKPYSICGPINAMQYGPLYQCQSAPSIQHFEVLRINKLNVICKQPSSDILLLYFFFSRSHRVVALVSQIQITMRRVGFSSVELSLSHGITISFITFQLEALVPIYIQL